MNIDVLGTEYNIVFADYANDETAKKRKLSGYTSMLTKKITIINAKSIYPDDSDEECRELEKETIRHEVVHAFLYESGLDSCSQSGTAWAENEEMIDWIAIQGAKIYAAWQKLGVV